MALTGNDTYMTWHIRREGDTRMSLVFIQLEFIKLFFRIPHLHFPHVTLKMHFPSQISPRLLKIFVMRENLAKEDGSSLGW